MKKKIKADLKMLKKQAKYFKSPDQPTREEIAKESRAVKFSHIVKGTIYVILSVTIIISLILGQTGLIITLEDLINNLVLALAGKIILAIIALAFLIYGLKQLYLIR